MTSLTDDELTRSLVSVLGTNAGPADLAALLARVHAHAEVRRRRRARAAAGSAVVSVVLVASAITWGLRSAGDSATSPAPAASGSASSASGLGFTPGRYGGVVTDGLPPKLDLTRPFATLPLLPAAVKWGDSAVAIAQLDRVLYDVQPDGSVPANNPALLDARNVGWVAFPFPANALLQPKDVGSSPLYLSADSVQTSRLRVQMDASCAQPSATWLVLRVAGATLTWSSSRSQPGSSFVVSETVGAFEGDGSASALASGSAAVRCSSRVGGPLTPVTVTGLPGTGVVAGVGRDERLVPGRRLSRFLGVARVGQLGVGIDYWTRGSTASAASEGQRLLRAAVARVRARQVQDLVARYAR